MKTICTYSYDLDCAVASLIYKWVNNIANYNFVAEPMAHNRIRKHCDKFVNKKEGNFLFMGFSKDELVAEGCDKERFKSLQKFNHKSLSKILYDKFKETYEFNKEQKTLIATAIDKHLFNYNNRNSYLIDLLFHKLSSDKFFYMFNDGMISLDDLNKSLLGEELYRYSKQTRKPAVREFIFDNSIALVGTVTDASHYEYEYMTKYDAIGFIDTEQQKIYFRNKNPENKVLKYCREICDGNGTNDYCSGYLTNKFMEDIR